MSFSMSTTRGHELPSSTVGTVEGGGAPMVPQWRGAQRLAPANAVPQPLTHYQGAA